jgi:hypothetical protein
MFFYGVGNHPDISVVCGDSLISASLIARYIDETWERWGLESLLPQILVNASLASASCRRAFCQ